MFGKACEGVCGKIDVLVVCLEVLGCILYTDIERQIVYVGSTVVLRSTILYMHDSLSSQCADWP